MGHYCRICGRIRANEKFSGRGHRAHICKDCQRQPLEERDRIMCTDELCGFLDQSHISQKNIERLGILTRHADPGVRKLAVLVLEVARVKPHKRRRLKFLAENYWIHREMHVLAREISHNGMRKWGSQQR